MNEDQKTAIDAHMSTLAEVLQSSVFEVFLSSNGFLSNDECEVVTSSGPTNGHKVIKIFSIVKWKEGSWELVMKYLRDHKYPWLVKKLLVDAKMETEESKSVCKQPQLTTTSLNVQCADACSSESSRQCLTPSGCVATSAWPRLRVPPVTSLIKSNSDLSFKSRTVQQRADRQRNLQEPNDVGANKTTVVGLMGYFNDEPTDSDIPFHARLEAADDVERLIATLKENSNVQPFVQLLPEIISLMQLYPTDGSVRLECIRLIQSFLPLNLLELTAELNENVVETILNCLQSNFNDESTVACCLDALDKLEISSHSIDKYLRTVEILLKIISNPKMTTTTKGWTICLLTAILRKSDETQQHIAGQMGGVEQICRVIRKQLYNPNYNRILAFSWICLNRFFASSLGNNKSFLSAGGINLFHLCYEMFDHESEMVQEMMGIMSNLTCFQSLKPQLVSKWDFEVFWKILIKSKENVRISYRCVRFFNNFLSDSTIIWPLDSPTAEEAENFLIVTINKWKLDAQTNYKPIPLLNELKLHVSSLSDVLDIWTIANLTTVDAPKYCRMLSEEGGVEILTTEVIRHSNASLDDIRLAIVALDNVKRWKETTTTTTPH